MITFWSHCNSITLCDKCSLLLTLSSFTISDTYHIFDYGVLSILKRLLCFEGQSFSIWFNDHIKKIWR